MARPGGIDLRQGLALGMTLLPVSATTLALLADLGATHPLFADQLAPVVLSAIALMALLGPIAVEWGLRLGGEHQPRAHASHAAEAASRAAVPLPEADAGRAEERS